MATIKEIVQENMLTLPSQPDSDQVHILCIQQGIVSWQPVAAAEVEHHPDDEYIEPPEADMDWHYVLLPGVRNNP